MSRDGRIAEAISCERMGRTADAVLAYEHAVELYAAEGFVARAAAMAKVVSAIEPAGRGSRRRVDREAGAEASVQVEAPP